MPRGIPYIVGNEAAERFSFYGMKGILVIFMTRYLMDDSGSAAVMGDAEARSWYHLFTSAVYFTPIFGALLADLFFGKYRTIIGLSLVYCLGHLALALDDTRLGLGLGLGLIAAGSGGIKPCVSAHVGDQFADTNAPLLERAFGFFYFAINLGAFVSMLLTPWLLQNVGPHAAFGVPGLLMLLATIVFWAGRWRFVHIPPDRRGFLRELSNPASFRALGRLAILYVFVAMFWALFDQTGSSWVLQAQELDRRFLGYEWLPSQIQALNPVLILLFIPLFSFGLYPLLERIFAVTPLRKIGIGLFITVGAFLVPAFLEMWIAAGATPSIGWQLLAYAILTAAEVFVSITCLEFSYTQAPRALKSVVMALFLMSVSLGNLFTSGVNYAIQRPDGSVALAGATYYLFFAGLMLATALLFVPVAMRFREHTYIQEAHPT
ncbi:MAG: POT family MFS transporter [Myxococcota bacterium]